MHTLVDLRVHTIPVGKISNVSNGIEHATGLIFPFWNAPIPSEVNELAPHVCDRLSTDTQGKSREVHNRSS